jgi:hypothetical protein
MTKEIILIQSRILNKNMDRLREANKIKREAIEDAEYMTNKCIRLMKNLRKMEEKMNS